MREDLALRLYADHPCLSELAKLGPNEISCDSGWVEIIDMWCRAIDIRNPDAKVTCVKEKFGELRIYTDQYFDDSRILEEVMMAASRATCEICGEPGKINVEDFHVKTVCPQHLGYAKRLRD